MPASDISEQISLAGKEASGTGNMKLMLNGAITLGTLDGANVEIHEAVGDDNIIIFGMTKDEVIEREKSYKPEEIYNNNPLVRRIIDKLCSGVNGHVFKEVADSLRFSDPYMVLADFDAYRQAQLKASALYADKLKWARMSLMNIAGAGIHEYADNILSL